jgi:hypothetical protein
MNKTKSIYPRNSSYQRRRSSPKLSRAKTGFTSLTLSQALTAATLHRMIQIDRMEWTILTTLILSKESTTLFSSLKAKPNRKTSNHSK